MIGPFMQQWLRGSRGVVGIGAAFLFFLVIALHGSQAASAATITVTNANDTITAGDGVSLREAVQSISQGSNVDSDVVATGAYGTNDTIIFKLPAGQQTIVLINGTLVLEKNVTITGPGASTLAVDGGVGGGVTVFEVKSGVTANLSGLTIQNGKGSSGGGIRNAGTVTVTNSTFSGNSAVSGGGIYNGATLTVTNSTFSRNSASGGGGGIRNDGTLTVTNSTLSGNSAPVGGGISNGVTLTVTNSTFSGNSAGSGGGIYNIGNTVTLINAIVANSPTGSDLAGTFGGSNNLIDDTSGPLTGSHNITGKPALLGTLAFHNGGTTKTFDLLAGSPALDAGDAATCAAPSPNGAGGKDQNGTSRPQPTSATTCDIGAFESALTADSTPPTTTATLSGTLGSNGWYRSAVTVTLAATDPDDTAANITTTYTVDGGVAQAYTAPFTVSGDGTHTVTFSSTDKAGNTEKTRTQAIKIDTTPPTITAVGTPTSIWPPNHKLVDVNIAVTLTDTLSGPDGFVLLSATASGDPTDLQGFVVGAASTSGPVRANKDEVYTLTYQGKDQAGNTATAVVTIAVTHK